jgi:DnaJ-class molecular chaperone
MKPEDEEAPERFKKLVEAYEVLGDPEKKKSYDDQIGVNKRSQRPTVEHRWGMRLMSPSSF